MIRIHTPDAHAPNFIKLTTEHKELDRLRQWPRCLQHTTVFERQIRQTSKMKRRAPAAQASNPMHTELQPLSCQRFRKKWCLTLLENSADFKMVSESVSPPLQKGGFCIHLTNWQDLFLKWPRLGSQGKGEESHTINTDEESFWKEWMHVHGFKMVLVD